ncbi:hypothetical protein E2C01_087023 [Portunus trituberculatus]|uniref:Uncharacterized protein n=1 Tax=Portunus trituberculatus TaxID=210409 RepID=A0A5B7JF18_PORTR|nr:hypothetical protein [Portunus trituberculatus]
MSDGLGTGAEVLYKVGLPRECREQGERRGAERRSIFCQKPKFSSAPLTRRMSEDVVSGAVLLPRHGRAARGRQGPGLTYTDQ